MTVRDRDRNDVVLGGEFERRNGVEVITDVVAEHNMIGYSGTSTGGSLTVRGSVCVTTR